MLHWMSDYNGQDSTRNKLVLEMNDLESIYCEKDGKISA